MNKTGSWNKDNKGIQLNSASLIEWKLSQLQVKDSFLGTHETKPNKKIFESGLQEATLY